MNVKYSEPFAEAQKADISVTMICPATVHQKILFCATDPGGAKNLAPVAALLEPQHTVTVICSKQTLGIFTKYGLSASVTDVIDIQTATATLMAHNPNALVVGTSAADRADSLLIQAARNVGLPSLAVLDEWYYYAARFSDSDGNFTHLPDTICCQDELARTEAIAEGIPSNLLHITGSPALAATFARLQALTQIEPATSSSTVPNIVFVSEQIVKAFGAAPGETGFVGPFIGYSERTVRNEIAHTLNDIGMNCRIFEKLHPNETEMTSPPFHGSHIEWVVLAADTSLIDTMRNADAIIGMRSIALLEAAMIGFRPASYQPERIGPNQCTAARLGLAKSLSNPSALKDWLMNAISGQKTRAANPEPPTFATPNAAQNVCDVIATLLITHAKEQRISD